MARTKQGAVLTEQHRRAQLQIRAQAIRDFTLLWPIWHGDDQASFDRLIAATVTLVRVYRRLSAAAAASYYTAFRDAEKAVGVATPRLAGEISVPKLAVSMYVTGIRGTEKAIRAGQDGTSARETALVRVSGAVTRHVLAAGRHTIVQSSVADPNAYGWARVTDPDPCAFCAMLSGRGPVYKSHDTADFEAHDHCGCSAEPVYSGADWPGRGREFHDLYNQATGAAKRDGTLDRGTSNDLLNAFRRAYDAQRAGLPSG